jgi:NAD(P)-dependent dehydrogenase (short-subunit alcohol dehydrogenase family)
MPSRDSERAAAAGEPRRDFEGLVALVTGGGTGLGLEVCRGLLARGARAVVVASRDASHHVGIVAEGAGRVESRVVDVREPDRLEELCQGIVDRHGALDVAVANAAGNFVVPSLRLKSKAWRTVIDIALSGAFYTCQAAGRAMVRGGKGGAIVTIGATYAWTGMPGVVHSAAAKAGVLAVARTLAAEWASLGIRVNCVAPGPFHSEGAQRNLWPEDEQLRAIERAIPLGRMATASEVARAVLFLASPEASYVTGDCLVVDGGHWLGHGLHGAPPVSAVPGLIRPTSAPPSA